MYQKLWSKYQNWKSENQKTFQRFSDFSQFPFRFSVFGTVFGAKSRFHCTKILGFSDFFEKSPTLKSCNFFSTEPISIIFDFLESSISNSFISGVLVESDKNKVLPEPHQKPRFSKNRFHIPTYEEHWSESNEALEYS